MPAPAEPDSYLQPPGATPQPAKLRVPTTTTLPSLPPPAGIRVASGNAWANTGCPMFPDDNYWHADVRSLPTVAPRTPDGRPLAAFPQEDSDDPLRIVSGLIGNASKTITWASSSDPLEWVTSKGNWNNASEFTAVEMVGIGPLANATGGLLRHRVPEDVLVELSSTDDHALFVDTDACNLVEYIGWDRDPGELSGRNATINDLRTNERRLSVRPGWLTGATNGSSGVIDSPYSWTHPWTPGLDGTEIHTPRSAKTASGGSGLPTSPGMVRLDEVFASPDPASSAVAHDARIDHAIAVSVPQRHLSAMPTSLTAGTPSPFVWPATTTDGCAGVECFDNSTGSDFHIPMGARLRLSDEACSRSWSEPQAAVIVEAMCDHGIVVTDSSAHVKLAVERSSGDSKWRREAQEQLDTLTLRDFEMVDTSSISTADSEALWSVAVDWAIDRFGAGTNLSSGWYQGTFWNNVNNCDRADHDPMGATRPPCDDPDLARVDSAVNGPDWLRVR
ncbi:MAG: hypothetical protein ACR2OH_02775 [Microthrixaceae bacterium]